MPERRRSRTVLAALTLIALLLITVDYRQGGSGPIAAIQRGALIAYAPVQEGFAQIVQPIGGFFSSIGQLGSLREENAALSESLHELQQRLPSVANLERENAELRALLRMSERMELTTTAARVIGHPPGEQANSVMIDAGAQQGLVAGMAVVSSQGLVGKLTEVTPDYARVELLSSPTARYAVRLAASGETGLLRGQGSQPFQLELLTPEISIAPGAEVVTRSFQASTIPDGIPIGEVVERDPRDTASPRYLLVRPYVDFRRLSFVQVVLDAPTPPPGFDPADVLDGPAPLRPPAPTDDAADDSEGSQDGADDDGADDDADTDEPEGEA